ncbi:MAG: hypothetical protein ACJ8FY_11395 [Gemmataceae bacterium]
MLHNSAACDHGHTLCFRESQPPPPYDLTILPGPLEKQYTLEKRKSDPGQLQPLVQRKLDSEVTRYLDASASGCDQPHTGATTKARYEELSLECICIADNWSNRQTVFHLFADGAGLM